MQETSDIELLRQYAESNSEAAFAALVNRHINLVYSTALRKTGNPQAAQDITQAVYVILAQKAATLKKETILPGWLYQTARFTSAAYLRTEIRRAAREKEASMQSIANESESDVWPDIAPLLDDAMGALSQKDRDAIALRYFQGKSFQEVSAVAGVTENAAKKRVAHALEKLRKYFLRRGVDSSASSISAAISVHAVHAVPPGLDSSITAIVTAKGAGASTLTLVKGALKLMTWTQTKSVIAAGAALLLATGSATLLVAESQNRAADSIHIKNNWEAGKQYALRVHVLRNMEIKIPNVAPVAHAEDFTQNLNIFPQADSQDGNSQFDIQFQNFSIFIHNNGATFLSFDAASDAAQDTNSPFAPILRAFIGARLHYEVDAKGNVVRMDGLDKLRARVNAAGSPSVIAQLGELFSDDTFRRYGSIYASLPEHTLKIGDNVSVDRSLSNDSASPHTELLKYIFTGWEQHDGRQCASIEYTGKFSEGRPARPGNLLGINNGKIKGKAWFDPRLGLVIASSDGDSMDLSLAEGGKILTPHLTQQTETTLLGVSDAQ